MKLRQLSFGLKQYLYGNFKRDERFSIYGMAGFGLIIGSASNIFNAIIDTSRYSVQDNVIDGTGKFKRLSFDIAGGWEIPVGYEIYIYSEARLHIPTTNYPSNYLLKNNRAPFLGSINLGIRILFNDEE